MQKTSTSWYIIVTIIILTTFIISFYGFLIYRTIQNYNAKSLALQLKLEELKFEQEKMILQTEIEIQEQTFQFISMEIHDNITQVLSLAKLHLNCLELTRNAENITRLENSKELVSKSLIDLSSLSKSLDSDIIESHGLIHAVEYEIERWKKFSKNAINLEVSTSVQFMDKQKELLIFRIIQEALSNVMKHAEATLLNVQIEKDGENLVISIRDNGNGFDSGKVYENKKAGQMAGLKNMRQRAESLKGELEIVSSPGKGSNIVVSIPFSSNINEDDKNRVGRRSQTIA
jgi:two-component system, NarL family, sensor kinase